MRQNAPLQLTSTIAQTDPSVEKFVCIRMNLKGRRSGNAAPAIGLGIFGLAGRRLVVIVDTRQPAFLQPLFWNMKEIKLAILPLNVVIDANLLSIRSFQMRFVLVYNVIIGYREKRRNCEKYENEKSLSHIFIFSTRERPIHCIFLEFLNPIFFRKPVKMTGVFRA